MPTTPHVSVILLTYQQREFVEDAIRSVLDQTYPDVELVAIDNASTDGTAEVLARYADVPNVRVLPPSDNSSITRPLNEAIRRSSGDYISILYGDDLYLPEKLARQVRLFEGLPEDYGVVYSPGYRLDVATGERWLEPRVGHSGYLLPQLLMGRGSVNPISPLIRRTCLELHPFREDLFVEGEGIFFRFALTHLFLYDPEPLVIMREHGRNMGKAVRRNADVAFAVFDMLERDPRFPIELRPLVSHARADTLQRLGWWATRIAEDRTLARDAFVREIAVDRRRLFHPRVFVGLLLGLLPPRTLHTANRLINSVRAHRIHLDHMSEYPS